MPAHFADMPFCALLCRMTGSHAGKSLSVKQSIYVIAGLSILLLAMMAVGKHPLIVETYYTQGIYIFISRLLHLTLGWIPFSLGDVFYTAIIVYLFYSAWLLIRSIINKRFNVIGLMLLRLVIGIQLFTLCFYLLWGMNYFRPSAAEILDLPDDGYSTTELKAITISLIDSTNIHRAILNAQDQKVHNSIIYHNAKHAISVIGIKHKILQSFYPVAKSSLFTPIINYQATAGYFNPFTGEAQVNYAMPLVNKPVTACHEMAHQMGFAREDEANFIAFVVGTNSGDRLLQYSAYYMAMDEFMHQVYRRDTVLFHQLKSKISAPVKNDIKAERQYWEHYQNQIGYISSLFYDQFLKANNQPEGLRTYNRMINLTVAYYRNGKKFK